MKAFVALALVPFSAVRSPACVYGDPRSSRTVVLFGDSHALQYFPAVERIALARGLRLVHLGKAALARGYAATLRRLVGLAPRVVAVRDSPRPPLAVPTCVAAHMRDLRTCAFARPRARARPDAISRAIAGVRGVALVDPLPQLCPRRLCPAVIGDDVALARPPAPVKRRAPRGLAARGESEEEECHQVEANVPGGATGGISRTMGRE
jgi:hypothetical protein